MDEHDLPPEPSDVIKFDPQNTELITWRVSRDSYDIAGGFSLYKGRYSYVIQQNSIYIYDLFLGVEIKIVPKTSEIYTQAYAHLSTNRGLVVYRTLDDSSYASIVNINYTDRTYEVLYTKELGFQATHCQFVSRPTFDTVMFESIQGIRLFDGVVKLNIFNVNNLLSKINNCRSINISYTDRSFHIIDGRIVFARVARHESSLIVKLMYIDDNERSIEIENTGASLTAYASPYTFSEQAFGFDQSCWCDTKLFYLYAIDDSGLNERGLDKVVPFLWIFDMETKRWSKISLNFPLMHRAYRFYVDYDGFLSFVKYESDKSSPYTNHLVRSALKAPDKLLNLCWFKAHNYDLHENIPSLKLLMNPAFT